MRLVLWLRIVLWLSVILPGLGAGEWTWTDLEQKTIAGHEAKVSRSGPDFLLEVPRWRVKTQVDARFTAELTVFLDLLDRQLASALAWEKVQDHPQVSGKPAVRIFAQEASYRIVATSRSRGAFTCAVEGNRVCDLFLDSYIASPQERTFAAFPHFILLHEGTHLQIRRRFGPHRTPEWYDEGMASFFETWDLRRDAAANLVDRCSRSRWMAMLTVFWEQQKLPTLPEWLAELRSKGWNPDQGRTLNLRNYALAESLTDCLLRSEGGKIWQKTLETRIMAGRDRNSILDHQEAKELDGLWKKHLDRECPAWRKTHPGVMPGPPPP